jgi:hypothetical protein
MCFHATSPFSLLARDISVFRLDKHWPLSGCTSNFGTNTDNLHIFFSGYASLLRLDTTFINSKVKQIYGPIPIAQTVFLSAGFHLFSKSKMSHSVVHKRSLVWSWNSAKLRPDCSCSVSCASVNLDGFTNPSPSSAINRSHGLEGVGRVV